MPLGELLKGGGQVANMGGQLVGGVFSALAARQQMKAAKKQIVEGRAFNSSQQNQYGKLYDDLISKAQGAATYKGDTSAYKKVVSEAERQKAEAATSVNPADAMMREDARQSTANYIGAASRGARSASDLMSIAGNAYGGEKNAIRTINTQNAQERFSRGQNANNNLLNSLSDIANATARERGLEFESLLQQQNSVLGLTKEKGLGGLDMGYRSQQEDFARRAALVDIKSSLLNGAGDVFRNIGTGFAQQQVANNQMEMFKTRYGGEASKDFSWLNSSAAKSSSVPTITKPNGWGIGSVPINKSN